ncbi:MAG: glycosyltransferase family 87 protein [Alteraurantiacibacter sp.]
MTFLTHLREAAWLDGQRVRGYAVLLGLASLALLANSYIKAMTPTGSDFLAFWGAGHVTVAGDPALAYDLAVQERVQTGTGASGFFAFVNPPPFLFVTAPFGALPYPLAWLAWVILGYAAWAWAAVRAFPRLWPIVLVFPGALVAAGHAQTGFVTGALLVAAVALVDRRPVLSGALIGALIIKPHLALLLPFWLLAGRRWSTIAAAATSGTALLLLSWAVFGTATLLAYTTSWDASAQIIQNGDHAFHLRMATLYGQLRLVMPATPALAVNALLALGMVWLVMRSWKAFGNDGVATGALALAATALASPYLFNYDLPFLILPLLWLVQQGLARGFGRYEKLLLVALWLAPYATRAAALPLGVNLMPLAAAVLVWLVRRRGQSLASLAKLAPPS